MQPKSAYLSPDFRPGAVRVFAHRGLAAGVGAPLDENTLAAFQAASSAGADYIESDVQLTKDGIPVLFHDRDLARIAGRPEKIRELNLGELQAVELGEGGAIPTLREVLSAMPTARFNLDLKVSQAIGPAVAVISELGASERVLLTSFSDRRRRAAVRSMPEAVASSAGGIRVIWLYLSHLTRFDGLFGMLAKPVSALQLPTKMALMNFADPRFIARAQRHNLEVHFWTINDPDETRELILLGADGIVTDRADLARRVSDSLS